MPEEKQTAKTGEEDTLDTLVVTPKDFADTYQRTWNYGGYLATALHPDLTPVEIGRIAAENGDRAKRREVMDAVDRWRNGRMPFLVVALTRLHAAGVFPGRHDYKYGDPDGKGIFMLHYLDDFDYKNPNFVSLCLLSSIQFWKGTMSRQHGKYENGFSARIGLDRDDLLFPGIVRIANSLGGDVADASAGPSPEPTVISMEVSRMMFLLGQIAGRKSVRDDIFPMYIRKSIATISKKSSSEEEMQMALEIIKDFVMCFLALRCNVDDAGRMHGVIIPCQNEKLADSSVEIFKMLLGRSGFDMGFMVVRRKGLRVARRFFVAEHLGAKSAIETYRYALRGRIDEVLADTKRA